MNTILAQAYDQVRRALEDAYRDTGDPDLVFRLVRRLEKIACQLALLNGAKATLCREFPHLEPQLEDLETQGIAVNGQWHFEEYIGFVCDDRGHIYVADTVNHCVQHFDDRGNFIKAIGSKGDDDGMFNRPRGLAIGQDGSLYVADNQNHRIQVFANYDDVFVFSHAFGSFGSGWGQFHGPSDVALDGRGHIYVTDGNDRVQKFDETGDPLMIFSGPAPFEYRGMAGYLANPYGLAVAEDGTVYIADAGNRRIQIFDSAGQLDKVVGGDGTDDGEFNQPLDIALDSEGNMYVLDTGNHQVQIFDRLGIHLTTFGGMGSGDGQLYKPRGIALDQEGHIYVTDAGNHRIQKFAGLYEGSSRPDALLDHLSGVRREYEPTQFLLKLNGPIFDYVDRFNAFVRATSRPD